MFLSLKFVVKAFIKCFLCVSVEMIIFSFTLVTWLHWIIMNYTDWFSYDKWPLYSWNKSHLFMVQNYFNILLDSIYYYFDKDFLHLYIFRLLTYSLCCFVLVFLCFIQCQFAFVIRLMLNWRIIRKCFYLFWFLNIFVKDWL